MKYTNAYEEIKKGLVNDILSNYGKYIDELEEFKSQIKQGIKTYLHNDKPISLYPPSKNYIAKSFENNIDESHLEYLIANLQTRFEYIFSYIKSIDRVINSRRKLLKSVNELRIFNKITKDKFNEKKDATSIFEPITSIKVNNHLRLDLEAIETVESYLDNDRLDYEELHSINIVLKENGDYKINNDYLSKLECLLFENSEEAIKHDLKQVEKIEKQKECENYLEYILLFK
ncbi:hypothetical protein [Staphylococcus aureus]|nr:hypothetical protein [Staphylococcus aureus]